MKSKYMQYEVGRPKLTPLNLHKQTNNINQMSTPAVLGRLYKRHEILILYVAVAVVFSWAFVTKLG